MLAAAFSPGAQGRLALPVPGRSQSPAVAGLRPRGPCCPPAGASQLLQAACIPGLTAPPPSRKLRSLLLRPHVAGWKTPAALRAREAGSGPPGALWRQGRNDGVLPGVGRALSPWFRGCRCRSSRGCCHVPVSCRGTCPAGKPGDRAVVIFSSSTLVQHSRPSTGLQPSTMTLAARWSCPGTQLSSLNSGSPSNHSCECLSAPLPCRWFLKHAI